MLPEAERRRPGGQAVRRGRARRSSSGHRALRGTRPRRRGRRLGVRARAHRRASSRGFAGAARPALPVFGVEFVQLVEGCPAFVLGDGAVFFLQPADEFLEPVPIALGPQCLGDVGVRRLTSQVSSKVSGDPPVAAGRGAPWKTCRECQERWAAATGSAPGSGPISGRPASATTCSRATALRPTKAQIRLHRAVRQFNLGIILEPAEGVQEQQGLVRSSHPIPGPLPQIRGPLQPVHERRS